MCWRNQFVIASNFTLFRSWIPKSYDNHRPGSCHQIRDQTRNSGKTGFDHKQRGSRYLVQSAPYLVSCFANRGQVQRRGDDGNAIYQLLMSDRRLGLTCLTYGDPSDLWWPVCPVMTRKCLLYLIEYVNGGDFNAPILSLLSLTII